MKAISLWQPWASAIALGAKRIETRSWMVYPNRPLHRTADLHHPGLRRNADPRRRHGRGGV